MESYRTGTAGICSQLDRSWRTLNSLLISALVQVCNTLYLVIEGALRGTDLHYREHSSNQKQTDAEQKQQQHQCGYKVKIDNRAKRDHEHIHHKDDDGAVNREYRVMGQLMMGQQKRNLRVNLRQSLTGQASDYSRTVSLLKFKMFSHHEAQPVIDSAVACL